MPQEDAATPVHARRGTVVADRQPWDESWRRLGKLAYQREAPDSRWRLRPGLPGQLGAFVRNELGDDAVRFVAFQPVGDVELLHQPQEVRMQAGRIRRPVIPVL